MADFRTKQLRQSEQTQHNIGVFFDRYRNHVDDFHSAIAKIKKVEIVISKWVIAEIIMIALTGGIVWENGIADVKSIIALVSLITILVTRLINWHDKRKERKFALKKEEYEFKKKVALDKRELSIDIEI
jgi:hypothetical protein